MVSVADRDDPLKVAEIVTVVGVVTAVVAIVNAALSVPELTVTLGGTIATGLLLANVTVAPVVGGAFITTEPCTGLPPTTAAGVTMTFSTPRMTEGGVFVTSSALSPHPVANNVAAKKIEQHNLDKRARIRRFTRSLSMKALL